MLNITTKSNRYGDGLQSDTINVEGLHGTRFALCHIGIVPEGRKGRKVHGGPLVPGPWGFAVTHPLVIDNYGGSARERAEALTIKVGEPFTVDGMPGVWTFRSPNRYRCEGDGPKLDAYEN
jgi:hypothetical protein